MPNLSLISCVCSFLPFHFFSYMVFDNWYIRLNENEKKNPTTTTIIFQLFSYFSQGWVSKFSSRKTISWLRFHFHQMATDVVRNRFKLLPHLSKMKAVVVWWMITSPLSWTSFFTKIGLILYINLFSINTYPINVLT